MVVKAITVIIIDGFSGEGSDRGGGSVNPQMSPFLQTKCLFPPKNFKPTIFGMTNESSTLMWRVLMTRF